MVGEELDDSSHDCKFPNVRKTYWRSSTWNVQVAPPSSSVQTHALEEEGTLGITPQTRRLQGHNASFRSRVPPIPIQPLSIARRSFDDWPSAGLDDAPDLISPITPGRRRVKAEIDIKLDLASVHRSVIEPTEIQLRRDKFALFDKQCSRVVNYHIYLGSDAVARDREILRANEITHVLNCVGFVCPEYFKGDLMYKTLWLQDSPCEDITSLLYDVFDYFEEIREQGGRVFVHCCQGVSRCTSLVIGYLMWKEHSSFEEAFQKVKAARGVANPNMGFACQLLQCQKRVHATPMSPKSCLRMYRLVPHSPYDPLHLVPKALSHSGASSLDSRGAFVIHVPCAVLVWVGHDCDPMMAQAAEAAAAQVIRYERAEGPVRVFEEGNEGVDFWKTLTERSQHCSIVDDVGVDSCIDSPPWAQKSCRNSQGDLEMFRQLDVGNRKVPSYDSDYILYRIARRGGVIPPVSLTGVGVPAMSMCVPITEDGWSLLRRKLLSREVVTVTQKRSLEQMDKNDLSPCPSMASASPHFSPFSATSTLSSTTPAGSNSSFGCSPLSSLGTLSPITPDLDSAQKLSSVSSSHGFISGVPIDSPPKTLACACPYKSLASALAQRRGSAPATLKLPSSEGAPPPAPRGASRKPKLPPLATVEDHRAENSGLDLKGVTQLVPSSTSAEFGSSSSGRDSQECDLQIGSSSVMASSCGPHSKNCLRSAPKVGRPFLYLWPGLERIDMFDADDLDTRSVFILVESRTNSSPESNVYVWVGRELAENKSNPSGNSSCGKEVLWLQVGQDFVDRVQFPANAAVKVVREGEETEEFWDAFNQG